jgi:hypothetical protein
MTVEIKNDINTQVAPSDDSVVVILDSETDIIQTLDQGPPGPPGPQGPASSVPGPPGPPGNTILYGTANPTTATGNNGDFYINTATNFIFGPKVSGSWPAGVSLVGPQGPQGIQGVAGNTVLYGPTDPVGATGVNGNFYINTNTHFMFGPKASGAWPPGTSLIGPQGIQGPTGAQGAQGATGVQGPQGPAGTPSSVPGPAGPQGVPGNTVLYGAADPVAGTGIDGNFYINTTTHFMFGPKAAGAWPAGTSLVGPTGPTGAASTVPGPQGPQGVQGVQGPTGATGPPGPVPEAPTDGQVYGRQSSLWTPISMVGAIESLVFNGGMEIDQNNAGAISSQYVTDGWAVTSAGAVINGQQVTDAPPGFANSLKVTVPTPKASLAAGDYAMITRLKGSGRRGCNTVWHRPRRKRWGSTSRRIAPATIPQTSETPRRIDRMCSASP